MAPPSLPLADAYPSGRSENGVLRRRARLTAGLMRAMFVLWIALIASGIVFYTVVGLSHG